MPDIRTTHKHTGEEVRPRPRVVLLGDPQTAEFSEVHQLLQAAVPAGQLSSLVRFDELTALGLSEPFPEFIVVVQTWSDEWPFEDFLKLPGFGPLTRIVCCFGPWCVSDGRSRQDWPLALRISLEHFDAALRREWQQLEAGTTSHRPLAWTAGRDEIFHRRQPAISGQPSAIPLPTVRIVSADRELANLWRALIIPAGFSIAGDHQSCEIVLWDADPLIRENLSHLDELQRTLPDAKVIALVGFSTPDVVQLLRDRGAVAVLCKLLPLDSLLDEIQALAQRAGRQPF